MNTETFHLDLITPCFCAGAEPDKQAEIRAPSIRGQLRWWFRTLGGFKSLADQRMDWREQERVIFGSTAGGAGSAGKLIVRVSPEAGHKLDESVGHPKPDMASSEGYLLFPLRQQIRKKSALQSFALHLVWRGDPSLWDDIRALVAVFGHLGSMGFRGRRAMGALAFQKDPSPLAAARNRFAVPGHIAVLTLNVQCKDAAGCITKLGEWLRAWRQHGRTIDLRPGNTEGKPPENPGFYYAKKDHDAGCGQIQGPVFRAAIGLPIIQKFKSQTTNWYKDFDWKKQRQNPGYKGEGRFASPVILRPHRVGPNEYRPLVIFVDAHAWPQGQKVYLNGQERAVSTALYELMKNDTQRLTSFP